MTILDSIIASMDAHFYLWTTGIAVIILFLVIYFWHVDECERIQREGERRTAQNHADCLRAMEGPRMTQAQMDAINADRNYWL